MEAQDLIKVAENGSIYFGDYVLAEKQKKEDFPIGGDFYKVKTYKKMTKLEKNGMFLYESVPGTNVSEFKENPTMIEFIAEGAEDAQITVGLKEETAYNVYVDGAQIDQMNTGLSGKLNLSLELNCGKNVAVKIVQV